MFKKSINTILIWIISSVTFVSIGSLVWYVSNSSKKMALEMQSEALNNLNNTVKNSMGDFVHDFLALARNLAEQRVIRVCTGGNELRLSLDRLKNHLQTAEGLYESMIVFNLQGQIMSGCFLNGQEVMSGDESEKEYVKAIVSGKEFYISQTLTKSGVSDSLLLSVAAAVKDKSGQLIGGVAVFPRIELLFEKYVNPLHFGKGGYAYVLDSKGRTLAHPNKGDILKDVVSRFDFARYALEHQSGTLNYTLGGVDKFMAFSTIPHVNWRLVMTANHSEMAAQANIQRNIMLGVGAGMIILLVGLIFSSAHRLVFEPLARIKVFVSKVAGGDYKTTLPGEFRYEMTELANGIQKMIAEIKNRIGFSEGVLQGIVIPCTLIGPDNKILWTNQQMIDLIGRSQQPEEVVGWHSGKFTFDDENKKTLAEVSLKEQRQISGENDNYINFMGEKKAVSITTTPFYDMDGNILGTISFWVDMTEIKAQQSKIEAQNEKIAATAREAFSVADQMAGATEELSAQIEQSSKGTDIQQERVTETATSMEEMNSTVLEVARNASGAAEGTDAARIKAQDGQSVVVQAIDAISQVQNHTVTLKENMQSLGQQAEDIGQVMNVISDIADQTNLLALNAAIEAARAGEAGRGFAVVADEVRKLAEKTMSATKEVGDAISNIQQGTRGAVLNMDEAAKAVEQATNLASNSGRALGEIVGMVEKASDQVRSIATASEEQSASSEEINMAIAEINRISTETAEAMTQSAQAVSDLARLAQELNTLIQSLRNA